MTDQEKKEKEVFNQEIDSDQAETVSGGFFCRRNAHSTDTSCL